MKKLLIAAAAASAVLFCSTGVLAQAVKSQVPTLKQQVEDLKEAVLMLQKRVKLSWKYRTHILYSFDAGRS